MPASKLTATAPPKPKKPTRKELEAWEEHERQRLALARDAKRHGRDQKKLEGEFEAYVLDAEPKSREVQTCGFRVFVEDVDAPARVDWKAAFIAKAGIEAAERLEKRAALQVTTKPKLRVCRV